MKNNPNYVGSTAPSIHDWYNSEIRKYREEYRVLSQKIKNACVNYLQHMERNTRLAYNLTKREDLADRVKLTQEFKKDYKDLMEEDSRLQALIIRKFFVIETIQRLSHDRKVHYEQLRNKDN